MKNILEIMPAVILVKKHGLIDVLSIPIGKIKYYTNGKSGLEKQSRACHSRKVLISWKVSDVAPIF